MGRCNKIRESLLFFGGGHRKNMKNCHFFSCATWNIVLPAGLEYGIVAACERFYLSFDSARSSAILKAWLSGGLFRFFSRKNTHFSSLTDSMKFFSKEKHKKSVFRNQFSKDGLEHQFSKLLEHQFVVVASKKTNPHFLFKKTTAPLDPKKSKAKRLSPASGLKHPFLVTSSAEFLECGGFRQDLFIRFCHGR